MTSLSIRSAVARTAAAALLAAAGRAQSGSYTIIDIGDYAPPGEMAGTNATGLNELGHVAAITGDGSGPYDYIPVLYRDGQLLFLGALPGSVVSGGSKGANNVGQVAGWAVNQASGGNQGEPFLWTEGQGMVNPIDDDPVNWSGVAWDVNDAGQAVMTSIGGIYDPRTGLTRISFPGFGNPWKAWDLNEDGIVAGSAYGPLGPINAYRYDSSTGTIANLNDPDVDHHTDAYGINDRGDVVGWSVQHDVDRPAMLWTAEGQTVRLPIGGLGDALVDNTAEHINNHGDIVGIDSFPGPTGGDPALEPVGWVAFDAMEGSPIVKQDLRRLLDPATGRSWKRLHPFEINDRGEICGIGVAFGEDVFARGFLMVPNAPDRFRSLAGARPGTNGRPVLVGRGTLEPGTTVSLSLFKARPDARAHLVWSSATQSPAPMGGVNAAALAGHPSAFRAFTTDANGNLEVELDWPGNVPGIASRLEARFLIVDPAAPTGFSASNVITQELR